MKALFLCLAAMIVALTGPVAPAAHPVAADPVEIRDVEDFFEPLSDHGVWIKVRPFGWCWYPNDVDREWRPYVDGRWLETEDGPYWESDEPWAWATYHYGRWFYESDHGWLWVPDVEWAPAWVDWREGEEVVGWAPLPPPRQYAGSTVVYTSEPYYIEPASYVFVEHHYLWHPIHFGLVFYHHDYRCHGDGLRYTKQVTNIKQITKIKNSNNVTVNQNATVNQSQVKVKGRNANAVVTQEGTSSTQQNTAPSAATVSTENGRGKRHQTEVIRGGTASTESGRGGRGFERVREPKQQSKIETAPTNDRQLRQFGLEPRAPRSIETVRPSRAPSESTRSSGRFHENRARPISPTPPTISKNFAPARSDKFGAAEPRMAQPRQGQGQLQKMQPRGGGSSGEHGGGRKSMTAEERAEMKGRGFRVD